jgi:hypothetical protein
VADVDPWLGVAWKVYAAQGGSGPDLKPSGKEGTFTLRAVLDPTSGQAAYYSVAFAVGDMPSCWQGLLLYPHGHVQFAPPLPLLQPWTPSGDGPWLAAADAVRQGLSDAMAHLEGVLYPGTATAANLTLVCVPKATTVGTPLLVLELTSATSSGSVGPLINIGTGHGDN